MHDGVCGSLADCINMSSHVLMGRPSARLETMVLVFRLVCLGICCTQKAMTFPVWVLFLNLCDKTPVLLRHIAY